MRGSIECSICIKQNGSSKPVTINTELAKSYYEPVLQLANELNLSTDNVLSMLLKLPDIVTPSTDVLSEEEWQAFEMLIKQAIKELNKHRQEEGKSLEADLLERIIEYPIAGTKNCYHGAGTPQTNKGRTDESAGRKCGKRQI